MRHRVLLIGLAGMILSFRGAAAQSTLKCRPADSQSAALIAYIKNLETTTDTQLVSARNNVYHLPAVATNKITLVTNEKTCAKASTAYGPPAGSTAPPAVYVIQLGTAGYAVLDPDQTAGEYRTVIVFDTNFRNIGGWTGP